MIKHTFSHRDDGAVYACFFVRGNTSDDNERFMHVGTIGTSPANANLADQKLMIPYSGTLLSYKWKVLDSISSVSTSIYRVASGTAIDDADQSGNKIKAVSLSSPTQYATYDAMADTNPITVSKGDAFAFSHIGPASSGDCEIDAVLTFKFDID